MYESGEDYLETILILKEKNGNVRSIDVARELGFSRPSVSRAMSLLSKDGYIVKSDDGVIHLTELGMKKAGEVYEKHTTLTEFLQLTAGIDAETAEKDACRIEHIISESTFQGIKQYVKDSKN